MKKQQKNVNKNQLNQFKQQNTKNKLILKIKIDKNKCDFL